MTVEEEGEGEGEGEEEEEEEEEGEGGIPRQKRQYSVSSIDSVSTQVDAQVKKSSGLLSGQKPLNLSTVIDEDASSIVPITQPMPTPMLTAGGYCGINKRKNKSCKNKKRRHKTRHKTRRKSKKIKTRKNKQVRRKQ